MNSEYVTCMSNPISRKKSISLLVTSSKQSLETFALGRPSAVYQSVGKDILDVRTGPPEGVALILITLQTIKNRFPVEVEAMRNRLDRE